MCSASARSLSSSSRTNQSTLVARILLTKLSADEDMVSVLYTMKTPLPPILPTPIPSYPLPKQSEILEGDLLLHGTRLLGFLLLTLTPSQ
jgi:hypothetical protein